MRWPRITADVHLVLVGFMLMLVFGVATWMFPRPARDDGRHRPGLAMGTRGSSLAALGGLGQLAAAIVFVLDMWPHVRMPRAAAPPSP